MMDYHEMAARVLQRRDDYVTQQKRRRKRAVPALAGLCLVALVGVGIWQADPSGPDRGGTDATMDGAPSQYSSQRDTLSTHVEEVDPQGEVGEQDPASLPSHTRDVPAQEPCLETQRIPASLKDLWGGIYWEAGHTVVLLTQDTPENRALVLRERPDLDAASVVFQTADHSLAYLTELQDRISQSMMDRKLPFVTTASLMEAENLIRVTVTTKDETKLKQLQDLDPTGTALDIQSAQASYDLAYWETE